MNVTERDMLDKLRERYTKIRPGTTADRYARAEHASYPMENYGMVSRIADFIALDTYGAGQIIGHEVKVSRSDWLRELADPTKAEVWARHCHAWYVVVPDAALVKREELGSWGLMVLDAAGTLRIKVRATPREPEPIPTLAAAWLGRSIAKTAVKEGNV